MSRTKKSVVVIVGIVSAIYKIGESMAFMQPVVAWIDGKIGHETFIELLLSALVLYLLFSHGEKESTETTQPPSQSTVQSPIQTLNPTIDASQHHHYHPPEPTAKTPLPTTLPVRRRKLDVVGKKGRIASLNEAGNALFEPEADGKYKAVIAEFRNEPGDFSVITWHHVRASIVFYDAHNVEVADIGRAAWVDGYGATVDFASQVTRKLIIAVFADKWLSFDNDEAKPVPVEAKKAKIVLQDDREFSLPFMLDFDLDVPSVGSLVSLTPPRS